MSDTGADNRETDGSITEGPDSVVDDWHAQDVERDREAAEEAVRRAEGDEAEAAEIFEQIRPEHLGDQFDVPADEREGTLIDDPEQNAP